jgi:hypothetical protein
MNFSRDGDTLMAGMPLGIERLSRFAEFSRFYTDKASLNADIDMTASTVSLSRFSARD